MLVTVADELHAALQVRRRLSKEATPPPPPPLPALEGASQHCSRWTPDRIRKLIATLPAAGTYPELVERAADVLERWYHRFPLEVWSRFVKFADSGTGRKQQLPKVLKEFNEAAPVLARLLVWVKEAAQAGKPPVAIVDLCSGFGFLAMFASELLPPTSVEQIYLVDKVWPNRNVAGSKGGGISTSHIYDFGSWPIRLVTLQVDITKGRELRDLGRHVIRDPCPTIICGIHLCGTLSLRAIQLFNDGLHSGCGVVGLILAPCCLPRRQQRDRRFCYDVGGHRFSAEELHDRVANSGLGAPAAFREHLFACIDVDASAKSREDLGAWSVAPGGHEGPGTEEGALFLARAPFRHAGAAAGDVEFGRPVVVEGLRLRVLPRPGLAGPPPPPPDDA